MRPQLPHPAFRVPCLSLRRSSAGGHAIELSDLNRDGNRPLVADSVFEDPALVPLAPADEYGLAGGRPGDVEVRRLDLRSLDRPGDAPLHVHEGERGTRDALTLRRNVAVPSRFEAGLRSTELRNAPYATTARDRAGDGARERSERGRHASRAQEEALHSPT